MSTQKYIKPSDARSWLSCSRRVWFDNNPPPGMEQMEANPFDQLIMTLGRRHEWNVKRQMEKEHQVVEAVSPEHTKALMEAGVEIIYQPKLVNEALGIVGDPDFLIRTPSGEYQAADAKLARSGDKDEIQIQLAVYRKMLGSNLPALVIHGNGTTSEIGDEADKLADEFLGDMRQILTQPTKPPARYALVERAKRAQRCHLENGNSPQEPSLTESEKADCQAFLKEMLQILPLVNIRAFEEAKAVAAPHADSKDMQDAVKSPIHALDTIVVPAQEDGFNRVFLGEDSWYAIRIAGGKLDKIKFIAAYQTAPLSAITHVAPVKSIEPYGDSGKYKVIFSEKAKAITPIPFADAPMGYMQSTRYTSFDRLQKAKKVSELFE